VTLDPGLDFFPLLAGVLAVATCGLLGNWLVLRRLSLMGDAISHSVLPGLVIAFLVTSTRSGYAMFFGAAVAGVVTVVLIELVKKLGRVEPGAAMGVVFSILFALGVLLIERAAVRHVDLDADCVLYGQLETLSTFGFPYVWSDVLDPQILSVMPRQITLLLVTFVAAVGLSVLLFKELRISAFDPALATTQGVNATVMHYVLMTFVAAATVAAFEAVGSILVIAMLIVPAVTARLLTDRLAPQLVVSVVVSIACALGGYIGSTAVPAVFDAGSVNAAGSMTVVAGLLLVTAAFASPRHGVIARVRRRRALTRQSAVDDLLARLMRQREAGRTTIALSDIAATPGLIPPRLAADLADRRGMIRRDHGHLSLTDTGLVRATELIRRHRQWESYLVEGAQLRVDHVHDVAEQLEHLPISPEVTRDRDPHGRPIPEAP
jgi:manganese/zinc/iron transport system permease protein